MKNIVGINEEGGLEMMKRMWMSFAAFIKSETAHKFVIELVAEVVATTISKLISGGRSAPQSNESFIPIAA